MKKRLLGVCALSIAFASSLTGCGGTDKELSMENVKVGFIFLHDSDSTYDKNFIDAANTVKANLGLDDSQFIFKTNIAEEQACYEAAADLVDSGCDVVFADSFGHERFMLDAAKEFDDVEFCHATGVKAHTEKLANFHNAFASIYEGRYLTGIAAGMKVQSMIDDKTITEDQAIMGYVGAYPYAEVISGYTAFYLGAKSVCDSVTMTVRFTESWYDPVAESNTAKKLIEDDKAVIISQHADSQGAPSTCEEKGVPNVFYNGTNLDKESYLIASRINWVPYMTYMIESVVNDVTMPYDWTGTISDGSVEVLQLNESLAASGTKQAIDAAKAKLVDGTLRVFDTTKFKVNGETLSSYLADVDDYNDYVGETEVVSDGYFHESEKRSAPYFDITIDGISKKDKA